MSCLTENMEQLAKEIIESFKDRKENLKELKEEVSRLLLLAQAERMEMREKLCKELRSFVCELEEKVQRLLSSFEEERFKAEVIWNEMEKELRRLRRDP